jgi:hypothetical protein
MEPAPFTVKLSIVTAGRCVEAVLEFRNVSDLPAHLLTLNACLTPELENDVFTITSESGAKIAYLGTLAKRRAPRAEDFTLVPPHEAVTARVRLDGKYGFLSGKKTYSIVYSAYHPYPNKPEIWQLTSSSTHFVFAG